MALQDFIDKSKERYREQGPGVLPSIGADFAFSAISRMPVIPKFGTNIFEREWDVLVILDATRLDMYRRLINPDADGIWSVGSSSAEWMRHTFSPEFESEMAKTAYITGNPFSEDECPREMFAAVDEVWRDHWDDEDGTVRPDPITDRVIARHREGHDRVVGHFMQPHYPFIGEHETETGKMTWDVAGDEAHQGEGLALWDQFLYGVRDDIDTVRQAYDDNLTYVWEHVETLRENVDGRLVVTADHGNALGELGMWGHKPGMPHPKMRRVPWDTYHCTDERTRVPDIDTESQEMTDRDEQLRSLGYL